MTRFRPIAPTIGETHNLHPRFTRTHSPPTVFTPWGRELELSDEDEDSEEVAALFDAFSDVSYWLAGQDQRHKLKEWLLWRLWHVSTLQKRFVLRLVGRVGKLNVIQCVGDNDLCIDHIQLTETEVIVEQMGSFEEDGALLITVMMQMQPFRNYL